MLRRIGLHEGPARTLAASRTAAPLTDIQDGTYARLWLNENQAGRPSFKPTTTPVT